MPVSVDPPTDEPQPEVRKRKTREVSYEPYRAGVKVGGRSVGLGSVGDDVARLQRMLNRRGADLVLDGIFGPKTETAVKKLQRAVKVKADGVVGRTTWGALGW
jgi:peptidoglycan hydrolase-like protein with peptidoglycan-binding domain